MEKLEFIVPPWYLEALEMEPAPAYEAIGLQWRAKVSFDGERISGREVVETTTETIQYGYLERKKLYLTVELPIVIGKEGRKEIIRPVWFKK